MATDMCMNLPIPGFKFDNCLRNSYLASKGFPVPKPTKTGTTIVGIVYKDGVILGADTRATSDTIVADKNCQKIHYIAPNMYCCGAGTAADTDMTCKMVSSQLALHRLATDRQVPVAAAVQIMKQYLYRYQGHIGAALLIGGYDIYGPHIYSIHPHGSIDNVPYETMGSGSFAAMSVFDLNWKPDLSLEEGKKLVRDAICSGIFNDLGSGSNVDMCVINKDGVDYIRPYEEANKKGQRQGVYRYTPGTTPVLTSEIIPIEVVKTVVRTPDEAMETE